ncbi:lactosylceramide 4-alpha-galactosyltransferase, partial [Latimeria chalumnae]|uniref:lactosylceramide 4-alpha-galactosyltransferase n=1 Tax=Latimeria chalumnae TaxID=7897 RepID=UPI0006D9294B
TDSPERIHSYSFPQHLQCPTDFQQTPKKAGGNSIFFVETSERTSPSFLFMCSVESAARIHPDSQVVVLMKGLGTSSPDRKHPKKNDNDTSLQHNAKLSLLRCFPNVEFKFLDLAGLFEDTPLSAWYSALNTWWQPFLLPVLSDACRIALMWKYGGIYLDTDIIVLKPLDNLTNVLGRETPYLLNGAFLAFEPKHGFIRNCLQDFVDRYNGWVWGHQGPQLVTRVLKKWCGLRSITQTTGCKGVRVLPREAFYPIPWQDWKKYFQVISSSELRELQRSTYALHVWNKKSQGTKFQVGSKTLLDQVYSKHCPSTYGLMKMYVKY